MQEQMEKSNKCTLEFANSIWLKADENLTIEQDFLQTNADYYDADIYQLPFDEAAVRSVNDWVSESTDGTIDEILTQMPENAVMYLISATILDAEWSEPYDSHQVREGVFTKEDGTTCQAEFMYETEYNKYLKDDNAQGFYKYYAGYGYAFAVLLPDEGISVSDYAASLTGDKLHNILSDDDKTLVQVNTAIPKFETAYETEMSDILKEMGDQPGPARAGKRDPGHQGLVQHLLLRRGPAHHHRQAPGVRPEVRPGGVHRHRDQRVQGPHGRAGHLRGRGPGVDD